MPDNKIKISRLRNSDFAEAAEPQNPVFEGIDRMDLRLWNRDTKVSNFCFLTYNGKSLANVWPSRDMKSASVMVEISYGKGKIILSQMLIGDKLNFEPVADKLFMNLIDYLNN